MIHKNDSTRGLPYQYTVHQALQIMQIHANGLMNLVVTHSEEFHRHSFPIDIDFEEGVVIFAATSTGAVVVYVVTEENVSIVR